MARRKDIKEKITLKFDIPQLDIIIVSMLSKPENKKFILNVNKLVDMFSEESVISDYSKNVRVYLIKKISDLAQKIVIQKRSDILTNLNIDGKYEEEAYEVLSELADKEVSEHDFILIDKQVSEQLRYGIIGTRADNLSLLLKSFSTDNFTDVNDLVNEIKGSMDSISRDLKNAIESYDEDNNHVSFNNSNEMISMINQIISSQKNPTSKIPTGIQTLNTVLNGGYEKGRLYIALGLPKGWKSGFLLNSALWAKRYGKFENRKGLKPVIVYLTMENSRNETFERLWSHLYGNDSNISDNTPNEVMRKLEENKIFTPTDDGSAELMFIHKSAHSIDTADMRTMMEDLEKEGKYCCFLIQDYLKRIKSTKKEKEKRLELSAISDEMKTIAKELDIPVLTAMQLNREAFRQFEDAMSIEGQINAVEKMGGSQIGESLDIIQNCDYAFIVNRTNNAIVQNEYNDKYFMFKLISSRGKEPPIRSFYHRFKENNDMALEEDYGLAIPKSILHIETVSETDANNKPIRTQGKRFISEK